MHQAHLTHQAGWPCAQTRMPAHRAHQRPLDSRQTQPQHRRRHAASYRAAPAAMLQHGREAIVLVDHGSKRAEANAMLEHLADVYRATSDRQLVRTAHMELAQPTIAEAIAECAQLGASRVIVAPFFLSRGRHITQDIPALVSAAAAEHPGVQCVIAEPLGTDELLAQLIEKRVQAAAAQALQH